MKNIRKILFLTSLVLVIIVIFVTSIKGKEQDQDYLSDLAVYNEAQGLLQPENLNLEQALASFYQLLDNPRYQDSIDINWGVAQALKYKGDLTGAKEYYEKIKARFPAVVTYPNFVREYGELLKALGDERGELYLSKVK